VTARIVSFSAAKARLGFSFSDQQFKKMLLDLTEQNNTLQSSLAQVHRMRNTTSQPTLSSAPSKATRSRQLRKAAMRVYGCLQLVCSAHNGHFLYMSLEDLQNQSRNNPLSVMMWAYSLHLTNTISSLSHRSDSSCGLFLCLVLGKDTPYYPPPRLKAPFCHHLLPRLTPLKARN
jgi:uncharacterized membrane protein YccC